MTLSFLTLLACSEPQPLPVVVDSGGGSPSYSTTSSANGDSDGDGFADDLDCSPNDETVFPYAGDIAGDGKDGDCDTLDCAAKWSDDGLAYFVVCGDGLDWQAANDLCVASGLLLASIRTADEQRTIDELMQTMPLTGQAWIGYHDQVQEGTWVWTDGAATNYTYWGTNQPDNANNSDCGQIGFETISRWNDSTCADTFSTRGLVCAHRPEEM
jgi:hypothetical protein